MNYSSPFLMNFQSHLSELDANRKKRHPLITYPYFDIMESYLMTPKDIRSFTDEELSLLSQRIETMNKREESAESRREEAVLDCHKAEMKLARNESWWNGFCVAVLMDIALTVIKVIWRSF